MLDAGHADLLNAVRRYARTLAKARKLAKIPAPPRARPATRMRWDEQLVVTEILKRNARGQPLAYTKVDSQLRSAGVRYFGTWEEAIAAAGLGIH